MIEQHRIEPGTHVNLGSIPADGKVFHKDRDSAETEFKALRKELAEWQYRLYAEDKRQILVVLQAMDAGGKDGTIRNVFKGVNPQGVRVTSFKVPSKLELAHDFLWRIHAAAPSKGMIGVFNRSHYEDVLVVRVHNIVPESVWRPRFDHINNFEQLLADSGTVLLKFYLHISKDEQKERFQSRLDDPGKNWKFSVDDLEKRKLWGDYMAAFEDVLTRCSTPQAPWYVIPANQKWYRNLAIARVLVGTLRDMNPQLPTVTEDLSNIEIE
jgi:PPK2 family polyphosphate:nucleotide phosphotransferase